MLPQTVRQDLQTFRDSASTSRHESLLVTLSGLPRARLAQPNSQTFDDAVKLVNAREDGSAARLVDFARCAATACRKTLPRDFATRLWSGCKTRQVQPNFETFGDDLEMANALCVLLTTFRRSRKHPTIWRGESDERWCVCVGHTTYDDRACLAQCLTRYLFSFLLSLSSKKSKYI